MDHPNRKGISLSIKIAVPLAAAASAVAVAVSPTAGANPSSRIQGRQAEAKRVLADINALDSRVNRAAEGYDAANLRLGSTQTALQMNRRVLAVATVSLTNARRVATERLVSIYESGARPSVVEVILGARNLDQMLTQLNDANEVVSHDQALAQHLNAVAIRVRSRQRRLRLQQAMLVRLVAERRAQRQQIVAELQDRQRLLSSVRGEIAQLQAADQRRELAMAVAAKARIAANPPAPATPSGPPALAPTDPSPTTTDPGPSAAVPTDSSPTPSLPGSRYGAVVAIAMQYLGVPYKWGGASPSSGFDCSGFIMYVYAQIGVSLPHYTGAQYAMGTAVPRDQLQPGDLVFFDGLGHAGIYIGNNEFVHAPHTGDVVKVSSISGWYSDTYVGARRL